MHTVNCLVAVGNDPSNKFYKSGVTTPELQILMFVHGPGSVTEIEVTGNPRINQDEERERLVEAYPKFHKEIIGFWRDNGGKFITDVRKLKLSPALMAAPRTAPSDAADQMEEEEVAKINKAASPESDQEETGEVV